MGLFSGFKKLIRSVTKPVSKVASAIPGGDFVLPAAATIVGGPAAGAAFAGANTYGKTGNLGAALGAAGGSYVGGKFGSSLGAGYSPNFGAVGGPLGDIVFNPGAIAGGAAGSYVGSSIGQGLGGALTPTGGGTKVQSSLPSVPKAKYQNVGDFSSLGDAFSGLNPLQVRSKIATEDIYGGGADTAESDYLNKSTNNRLLQEGSNYDLLPIEEQYFQNRGYAFNPGNKQSLLEAFARRY